MCCGGYSVCIGQPSCCSDYKENCSGYKGRLRFIRLAVSLWWQNGYAKDHQSHVIVAGVG